MRDEGRGTSRALASGRPAPVTAPRQGEGASRVGRRLPELPECDLEPTPNICLAKRAKVPRGASPPRLPPPEDGEVIHECLIRPDLLMASGIWMLFQFCAVCPMTEVKIRVNGILIALMIGAGLINYFLFQGR